MSSEIERTRDRILKACLDLLTETRGHGVRMSDIAKRAGVSRQALYLQFESRADLFVHTTYLLDRMHDSERRLADSRSAKSGTERLDAYIDAWADYLPLVAPLLHALTVMGETDHEAKAALNKRMADLRQGCEAVIAALAKDGCLTRDYPPEIASDVFWALIRFDTWQSLTIERGWSHGAFKTHLKRAAFRLTVEAQ